MHAAADDGGPAHEAAARVSLTGDASVKQVQPFRRGSQSRASCAALRAAAKPHLLHLVRRERVRLKTQVPTSITAIAPAGSGTNWNVIDLYPPPSPSKT